MFVPVHMCKIVEHRSEQPISIHFNIKCIDQFLYVRIVRYIVQTVFQVKWTVRPCTFFVKRWGGIARLSRTAASNHSKAGKIPSLLLVTPPEHCYNLEVRLKI